MKKVRIVLPGGGVKGTFQVGFLQAMEQSGKYEVDHVYGTSVGALIAPFAASGRVDRIATHFASLRSIEDIVVKWPWYVQILPTPMRVLLKLGAFQGMKLADQLTSLLADVPRREYENCSVVAWDLLNKRETWWTSKHSAEEMKIGLKASSNLWLVVPPLKIENAHHYIDGGATELVPISTSADDKFDGIYVIIYCDKHREVPTVREKAPGNALELMQMLHEDAYVQLSKREVAAFAETKKAKVVQISPPKDIFKHAMEIDQNKMQEFSRLGREAFFDFEKQTNVNTT